MRARARARLKVKSGKISHNKKVRPTAGVGMGWDGNSSSNNKTHLFVTPGEVIPLGNVESGRLPSITVAD